MVLAVSDEAPDVVRPYLEKDGYTVRTSAGSRAGDAYGVRGIPDSFLIGPDGKIVWQGSPFSLTDAQIEEALKGVKPGTGLGNLLSVPATRDYTKRVAAIADIGAAGKPAKALASARAIVLDEKAEATDKTDAFGHAQLGGAAGERWVGRAAAGQSPVPGGRTSVVAVTPGAALPSGSLAGLLIDEWVEVIPAREETTSLAFHFNAPGATAPQVMLLGVPQKRHEAWREDDLVAMIDEALAQARERLVDAEDLQGLGQLLPLLVTAENVEGDTIALGIDTLTDTTR